MQEHAQQHLPDRLSLEATACLTIRRPDASCDACAESCPAQAIAMDARAVELDHDICTGCARCVAACPTGALNLPAARPISSTPLECSRVATADQAEGAQVVPCLGGVTAVQLLEALKTGDAVTFLDRGWCADCASGGSPQPWADTVQATWDDLAYLNKNTECLRVAHAPLPRERAQSAPRPRSPRQEGYSRRQLFRRLTTPPPAPDRCRITAAAPFAGKVGAPALQARRDHLRALHGAEVLPAELFPTLEVTGTPDLRLAASLCPTEALLLTEEEETDRLVFDPALCLACGQCEATGGLKLRARGSGVYAGATALISEAMADCRGCLRRFAPRAGQRTCDACHKDTDLAAAAFGLMRRSQVPYGA